MFKIPAYIHGVHKQKHTVLTVEMGLFFRDAKGGKKNWNAFLELLMYS